MLRRKRILAGSLMAGLLLLSACGGTSSGNGNGTQTPGSTATAAATATTKPKPSSLPPITLAYCQQLMTTAEAAQIMGLSINAIVPDDGGNGGSCTYKAGSTIDLTIYFITGSYSGPTPIPDSYITAALAQSQSLPGLTVTSSVPVTGVGDQAEFVSFSGSQGGIVGQINLFYTLYGSVLFDCFTLTANGISGFGPPGTQTQLQTCATQVVNRM
jgi:hypothetical protein